MISFGGRKPKIIATSSVPTSAVPSVVRCMSFLISGEDGGDDFIARRLLFILARGVICRRR